MARTQSTCIFILITPCILLMTSYNALGQVGKGLVMTTPSINLRNGTSEGILPCTINNTLLLHGVSWSKGTSIQTADMVIYLDLFTNPGERTGPGFEDGSFDIMEDFSLVMKDITFQDAGQYHCSADLTSGEIYQNATNVTVFEPPIEPFPLIQECVGNRSNHIEMNCTLETPATQVNITCSVHRYYPEFNVNFHHKIHPVRVVLSHEWENADGLRSKSVTVQVISDPIPYECIAIGIDSSGKITIRTATILLGFIPREISHEPDKTATIIGITMAVLIAVIICPSVFFLVRKAKNCGKYIVNRRKNASFQSVSREMEIIADISNPKEGQIDAPGQEIDNIPKMLQQLITTYHSVEKWQENSEICHNLAVFFKSQGAILQRTRFDSIHFYVLIRTAADEFKFLKACKDGTLSTGLTNLLVTPELGQEAGVKLEVNIIVQEATPVEEDLPRRDLSDMSFYQERKTIVFHDPSHNVDDMDINQRPVETGDNDIVVDVREEQWKTDLCHHYHNILDHVQTNPRDPDSVVDLQSIYIHPVVARGLTTATMEDKHFEQRAPGFFLAEPFTSEQKKHVISHEGFQELLSPGLASKKILLVGEAGIGKTTFIAKLVHDWMAGKEMKTIELLFHIPLAKTKKHVLFSICIQEYLSDLHLSMPRLDEYIALNQAKVIFLFDGLDDYEGDITKSDPNNALVQIMRGEMFEDSVVLVSTRPCRADQILGDETLEKRFTSTSILGFDKGSAKDYVSKFFKDDQSSCKDLHEFLDEDSKEGGIFSTIMAENPMFVAMLCHMWRDNPRDDTTWKLETVAQLINEMVLMLKGHLFQKSVPKSNEIFRENLQRTEMALVDVGRIAYNNVLANKKIAVDEKDCLSCDKNSFAIAFSVGILTKVRVVLPVHLRKEEEEDQQQQQQQQQKKQQYGEHYVMETRFSYILMQEYLAAIYIASLYQESASIFENILQDLLSRTKDDLKKYEFLWYLISARGKEVGRATIEFLRRAINNQDFIVQVAFECHEKNTVSPIINDLFTRRSLRLWSKRSYAAHLFMLEKRQTEDTLLINVLPESKMLARTAAQTIFTLERLSAVDITNCGTYSEEFYAAMNVTSSSSPPHIQILSHCTDKLTACASLTYARAICSMTSLRVLKLVDVEVDNGFYATMAQGYESSQIETLVFSKKEELNSSASRDLAKSIMSMPRLRNLFLSYGRLDDTFYKNILDRASQCRVEKISLWSSKPFGCDASVNLMTGLFSMVNLNTLVLFAESLDDSCFSTTWPQLSSRSKIEKLYLEGMTRHDGDLVKGISPMPSLHTLYIARPGQGLLDELCSVIVNERLRTIILRQASLKRRNLRELLSLKTLRAVRFSNITADDMGRTTDDSSDADVMTYEQHVISKCLVKEIRMDDVSLPHLLQLGLHTQLSKIHTIQLDFTRDVTNDVMEMLQGFPSFRELHITAYRKHGHYYCEKLVALKDTLKFCDTMTSFHDLTTLGITDVSIGDDDATQILEMTRNHRRLDDVSIARCNTTNVLDPLCERVASQSRKTVKVSYGKPSTQDNIDDDRYADFLHRMDYCYIDDFFTIITEKHGQ